MAIQHRSSRFTGAERALIAECVEEYKSYKPVYAFLTSIDGHSILPDTRESFSLPISSTCQVLIWLLSTIHIFLFLNFREWCKTPTSECTDVNRNYKCASNRRLGSRYNKAGRAMLGETSSNSTAALHKRLTGISGVSTRRAASSEAVKRREGN